jgi:hypothetical protein
LARARRGFLLHLFILLDTGVFTDESAADSVNVITPPAHTSPTVAHAGSGPLSADDLRTLTQARTRARKVRRAATVAAVSGWSMAAFAGLTLLAVLFGDLVALVLGSLLGGIAYNELRGAAMLRRFDPRGAARLGINQIALGILIVAYAAWSLYSSLANPALGSLGSTGDPSTDALVRDLTNAVTYGLYGGMAVIGVVVPGLTAWYYFARGPIVKRLVLETPAWAIETLRIAA